MFRRCHEVSEKSRKYWNMCPHTVLHRVQQVSYCAVCHVGRGLTALAQPGYWAVDADLVWSLPLLPPTGIHLLEENKDFFGVKSNMPNLCVSFSRSGPAYFYFTYLSICWLVTKIVFFPSAQQKTMYRNKNGKCIQFCVGDAARTSPP